MRIEVYSTFLPEVVLETNEWTGDTFAGFLDANKIEWRGVTSQPVVVKIDDAEIPPALWEKVLSPETVVRVYALPRGGVFKSIGSIIGKIFNAVFGWLTPKTNVSGSNSAEQSKRLETVDAKANQAKLGQVVPEIAGRHQRYPDYLVPPHRFFENQRTQRVQFLVCIGPGLYGVNGQDVKIGDTPFDTLGDDATYQIYPPGVELSGDYASEHWHQTEEVGGTSSGTPGLVLSTNVANRDNVDPAAYVFDWDNIRRTEGGWPSGWGPGSNVQVEFPVPYQVVTITVPPTESAPGYQISEITGWFHHLPNTLLAPNAIIGLGPIDSVEVYRIRSIAPGGTLGIYTVRLEQVGTGNPIVLPPGPSVVLRFGSDLSRNIYAAVGEDAFQVAPGRFQTEGDPLSVAGAKVRYRDGAAYGEWTGEFVATPAEEKTSTIEYDVFYQNGLAYIEDDAKTSSRSVSVQFQYRDIETGVRTTVTKTYTEATLDEIGFTERIDLPYPMRPSCRMRRITANAIDNQVRDQCTWYGLKVRIPTRTVYPDWTTMSVSLRSGGRIAAQSENQINLVVERLLPQLNPDNTWTEPQATRQISAFFRYILTTIGYTDEQIDMEALQQLHSVWYSRGETLDYVFDETTVKEALQLAVEAGMGEFTISDGKVRPIREGVRTVFEQSYSPQNMTSPLRRQFASRQPNDPDGVEVEFINSKTWAKDVVRCGLPGDNFFKVEKITVKGVTDRTIAWRIGMRYRRRLRYRRWTYNFSTELDALNSEYKSYVPLFDDIPGFGQSSPIVHVSAAPAGSAKIVLNDAMTWEDGKAHIFGYRRPDGTFVGPYPAERGDSDFEVIVPLPQPWPTVTLTMELPHAFLGVSERFCFPAWITDISPKGNDSVSVKAENYDGREYASDDAFPPD
ncbi:Tip attachment protein J domain-containing protein [Bordetella tumbae]|uniref:host specificity factor TipJ family phage tail protein n=1 Tax=Bordetella tumbae TaxID=1649139 RepID=UPI0039F065EB